MQSVDSCWVDGRRAALMGSFTEVTWKLYYYLQSALDDLLLTDG